MERRQKNHIIYGFLRKKTEALFYLTIIVYYDSIKKLFTPTKKQKKGRTKMKARLIMKWYKDPLTGVIKAKWVEE